MTGERELLMGLFLFLCLAFVAFTAAVLAKLFLPVEQALKVGGYALLVLVAAGLALMMRTLWRALKDEQ